MIISKVTVQGKEFKYPVFDYLSTGIFEFAIANKIDVWTYRELKISELSQLESLIQVVEDCLCTLLDKFYEAPDPKKRSKFSSRYEKITSGGKTYIVDYRTNPVGREAVGIYSFLDWLINQRKPSAPENPE
jgi:intein/homing endonuclease